MLVAMLLGACVEKTLPDDPVVAAGLPDPARREAPSSAGERALDLPDALTASCAQVANLMDRVARNAGLEARSAIGPDTLLALWVDRTAAAPVPGCSVRLADTTAATPLHGPLTLALQAAGWQDRSRWISADAPDRTEFSYSREGALCVFAASWEDGDMNDAPGVPASGYAIQVVCIADRPDPPVDTTPLQ